MAWVQVAATLYPHPSQSVLFPGASRAATLSECGPCPRLAVGRTSHTLHPWPVTPLREGNNACFLQPRAAVVAFGLLNQISSLPVAGVSAVARRQVQSFNRIVCFSYWIAQNNRKNAMKRNKDQKNSKKLHGDYTGINQGWTKTQWNAIRLHKTIKR